MSATFSTAEAALAPTLPTPEEIPAVPSAAEAVADAAAETPVDTDVHARSPLPPVCDYISVKEALQAVNEWAKPLGFSMKILRSRAGRAVLSCIRAGTPPAEPENPTRKGTTSIKCECLYSVNVIELPDGRWQIRHRPGNFDTHNHKIAYLDRTPIPDAVKERIVRQHEVGIAPKEIIAMIRRDDPEVRVTERGVYNTIQEARLNRLAGGSNTGYARRDLVSLGAYVKDEQDNQHRVTHLFWAFEQSLDLFALYPHVLIVDSTYKTNNARLPLFELVGVDAMERTFCVGFAFLSSETEEDFAWAFEQLRLALASRETLPQTVATDRDLACMNALDAVFPDAHPILCIWHINEAVRGNCRTAIHNREEDGGPAAWESFESGWRNLLDSRSPEEYEERWAAFRAEFSPLHDDRLEYLQNTWLKYKERFVRAWTDKKFTCGIRTTGRVEGTHALLKRHLNSSELDLYMVIQHIKSVVNNQQYSISTEQSRQETKFPPPHEAPLNIFGSVRNHISHQAVRHVMTQLELAKLPELRPCTGPYRNSMGLPCAHELKCRRNPTLTLSDFHPHWRLLFTAVSTSIHDPARLERRRKLEETLRKQTTSTGRIRSKPETEQLEFERSQLAKRKEAEAQLKRQEREQKKLDTEERRKEAVAKKRQEAEQKKNEIEGALRQRQEETEREVIAHRQEREETKAYNAQQRQIRRNLKRRQVTAERRQQRMLEAAQQRQQQQQDRAQQDEDVTMLLQEIDTIAEHRKAQAVLEQIQPEDVETDIDI